MITVYHLDFNQFKQHVLLTGVNVEEKHYFPVAQVDTEHIGTAYGLTQHPEPSGSWQEQDDIIVLEAPMYRSSMVGDLLAYPDGRLYMVMGIGYKQVHWGAKGIKAYLEPGDELSDEFLYEFTDE